MNVDLSNIPRSPGVYLMRDADGKAIYVGKAIRLRDRVGSYFRPSADHAERIALMVRLVRNVDFIVTRDEVEALILENNLIKSEQPRFNVMLRDDKTYPYLRLSTGEKFPRLTITRKPLKDGSTYFGPYISAKSVRTALELIQRIFPLRLSTDELDSAPLRRPCLNYQMKRCLAPCAGKVSEEDYKDMVERAAKFIRGKDDEVLDELEKRMGDFSEARQYEKAALLRDQISAIREIREKQRITSTGDADEDYVAVICEGGAGVVRMLMVRGGKLEGDKNFTFKKADDPAELAGAFIEQFYNSPFSIPSEILVNVPPADCGVVEKWLVGVKGRKTSIRVPERGRKRQIMEMALENARHTLAGFTQKEESLKEALGEIKNRLNMQNWPTVMEAVDASNISGVSAVGSLVTFFNGAPDKKRYKRYNVSVSSADDYAMISEVVRRRFKRLSDEGKPFPDVLLIDGGSGQVSAAKEAVRPYAQDQIIIGIAKGADRNNPETDRIVAADPKKEIPFPPASPGKFMLQRLRDEAHRFAIQFHRKTREKAAFRHEVDEVVGMGPKRRKLLLRAFGSLKDAKNATVEEIRNALSISEGLARRIHEKL